MNRSLTNVLFGGIAAPVESNYKIEGQITKASIDDTVDALANAESVIIVGLLVSKSHPFISDPILGCGLRDGCCESTICHIRIYANT